MAQACRAGPACQETAVQTLLAGSAKPGVHETSALELALVESAREASCCVLAVLRGPASGAEDRSCSQLLSMPSHANASIAVAHLGHC